MRSKEKTTWVDRLNQLLLEKALEKFNYTEVSFEEFKEYIEETVFIPDVSNEFIDNIYHEYLIKINIAGEQMTNKVTDKINKTGESLNYKMND
ncbi:MAG: hypothetical protein ACXWDO_01205 [Bacteroidia bacterium]